MMGGGFECFLFSTLFREDSHFDKYFSNGLKPPTRFHEAITRMQFEFLPQHNPALQNFHHRKHENIELIFSPHLKLNNYNFHRLTLVRFGFSRCGAIGCRTDVKPETNSKAQG